MGDSGWVDHRENGIIYSFDATKCMFSWGNLSEKLRMARLDCRNEVIVDLFAGIGYFVLPFLVRYSIIKFCLVILCLNLQLYICFSLTVSLFSMYVLSVWKFKILVCWSLMVNFFKL